MRVTFDLQVLLDAEADVAARDSTGGCALLEQSSGFTVWTGT